MYSQTRVQLYKVSTEALSVLSEALSSCPPRRSKRGTLLCHRPSAPSQDFPLWARQHGPWRARSMAGGGAAAGGPEYRRSAAMAGNHRAGAARAGRRRWGGATPPGAGRNFILFETVYRILEELILR